MLNFVAAHAGLAKSGPDPVLASMLATRWAAAGGAEIGLGWMIAKRGSVEIVSHGGGTGGFQSFIGFDPKARVGVVVLSNTQGMPGIEDIGQHLLDQTFPLIPAKKQREPISFEPKAFENFVGNYQLMPNFVLAVTREGDRFFTQATGQGKVEIFAMSERVFFPKVIDAELEFTLDAASGRASKVTLRQNGAVINGPRVEGPLPEAPAERKAIAADPKVLEHYVGKYQLAPGFILTITREEGRLFAQATGQGKNEIFAGTDHKFFRVVDAQITFTSGPDGRAAKLSLHQGGINAEGARVE